MLTKKIKPKLDIKPKIKKEKPKNRINYDLFVRQYDILNPAYCKTPIKIIGAGATGSFTALALAKMGFTNIEIFDADIIAEHNFPNQIYTVKSIGQKKTLALKEIIKDFTEMEIEVKDTMYKNQKLEGIVISAVDSMAVRKQIFDNIQKHPEWKVELLIDPRASAEFARVLSVRTTNDTKKVKPVDRKKDLADYKETLYADEDAIQEPCTGRSIIYSVLAMASLICRQIKRFQMNQTLKRDIILDLINDVYLTK